MSNNKLLFHNKASIKTTGELVHVMFNTWIYRFRFVGKISSSESESNVMPLFFLVEEALDFLEIFGKSSSSDIIMLSSSSSEPKLLLDKKTTFKRIVFFSFANMYMITEMNYHAL